MFAHTKAEGDAELTRWAALSFAEKLKETRDMLADGQMYSAGIPGYMVEDLLAEIDRAATHRRIMERVEKMTPTEFVESLVRAGIYTADGKLAPYYAGESDEMPEPWAIRQASGNAK